MIPSRADSCPEVEADLPAPLDGDAVRSPRMRVLCVLSSSNQMYSGIGRAVFELTRRLTGRIAYEFAIDDLIPRNTDLVRAFCAEQGIPLHVGPGGPTPAGHDAYNADLPELLGRRRWDAIECVCWANVATNMAVIDGVGDAALCYTPHYQPLWTVAMAPEQAANYESIHHRLMQRSDLVLCDSPWEQLELQRQALHLNHCRYVPLGCDFEAFGPATAGPRKPQLLFVGDLEERRKRFDRVLAVFARLHRRWPELRLVVVGNRSGEAVGHIPEGLRDACELRGYVSEPELRRAYAESLGLFLLSDFEAFGIPILEALASGTPVFLSRQEATYSLFGPFRGAHFCPADDLEGTLAVVESTLARGDDALAEIADDRPRLQSVFDWDALAPQKWQALAAAWFKRHYLARPFRGPRADRTREVVHA